MHHIEQLIKILTLPFTEKKFFEIDLFQKISEKECVQGGSKSDRASDYRDTLKHKVQPCVHDIFLRMRLIRNEDEVNLLLQKFYKPEQLIEKNKSFDDSITGITAFYLEHIYKIAISFLSHRDGRIVLKYWKSDKDKDIIGPYSGIEKIKLWHSLNQTMPTEIFSLIYLVCNGYTDDCNLSAVSPIVPIDDPQLEQILCRGMAETHMHLNAGGNFRTLWGSEMSLNVVNYEMKNERNLLSDGSDFTSFIKSASYLRVLLSLFLASDRLKCLGSEGYLRKYKDFFLCLFEGRGFNDWDLFNNLKEDYSLNEKNGEDILSTINGWQDNKCNDYELRFLFKSLKYITETVGSREDPLFYKLFFQYLRIKNIRFQNITQHNYVRGLDNFQRFYKKATAPIGSVWKKNVQKILACQMADSNLRKIELRFGFGNKKNTHQYKRSLKKNLVAIFEAYLKNAKPDNEPIPQIGFVLHMIKEDDVNNLEKCWLNYAENSDQCFLRFPKNINKYKMQIQAINELRENIPKLSKFIVGIDAASIENKTAPWVFAPVYQAARDSKTIAPFNSEGHEIKNLGFTYHVGEDFRHILTGLRHIDEVVTHFGYHAGDRIGHGIALGQDIKKWINHNRVVLIPRGEYLENLLWLWGAYKDKRYPLNFDQGIIELRIMELAQEVYQNIEGITVFSLWQAYQNKFTQFNDHEGEKSHYIPKLAEGYETYPITTNTNELFCYYVNEKKSVIWNIDKLTLAQHCKYYLEKQREPIHVEVSRDDLELFKNIQQMVASKVSREGIVVETNPTSNVTIGQFEHIYEHYILNLNDRGLNGNYDISNGLMVTINTDDPIVFNTNLSNEFAYIFYALQDKGYSRDDILHWIDRIRDNGMRSSFIPDRCFDNKQYLTEIRNLISELKK